MMKKQFVNIAACFILSRKKRHAFRNKFKTREVIDEKKADEVIDEKKAETRSAEVIQNAYDLSAAKAAKEAVVFIEIEPYRMCGGQMSLFSYCKYSKQVLGKDVPVLMTTMPGEYTYAHNDWFENDINICRWEQIMEILQNKEKVILHIPECDILNPETGEEMFKNRLTEKDKEVLKKIPDLRINIVAQEIHKTPKKKYYNFLFFITKNITVSTAHSRYSTQEVSTDLGLPLKKFSVFIDLSPYEKYAENERENIILLSPDMHPYRERISKKLRENLPDFQIIDYFRMSFSDCMKLTSRSFATISFGEGMDGYFIHPTGVKRLGLTVYNSDFFPNETWKDLRCVYSSYDDMECRIVDDIRFWQNNAGEYEKEVERLTDKAKGEYKFEEYLKNISDFYDGKIDFYPSRKVYIVGGNGFARECYRMLQMMKEKDASIDFGGFLGHGGYGSSVCYLNLQKYYVGEVSEHDFAENEYVVIGAGYPELRAKIYNELKQRNIKFFTIYTGDKMDQTVNFGEANIFIPPFDPSCNVSIGNGNVFNSDVLIGHDAVIGDCNFFGPRSQVLGSVKVGDFNQIGANTVLLPHCKIGNNNMIAPLSAVYKGCRNNCYMQGNPALKVGDLS